MKRRELIQKHITNIIKDLDSDEFFELLHHFLGIKSMYGYSVATLLSFEEMKVGPCTDDKLSEIFNNGHYFEMFGDWLDEKVL